MAALDQDTIAAIATPPGRGGIGIVRISGPHAVRVGGRITGAPLPAPRYAGLATFHDGDAVPVDRGVVLYFPRPRSFTGEDVVELHGHGGPVLMDLLLAAALAAGARLARPGEFTERAFLNGKLDLAQAEAVADLIDGSTQAAVRGAMRSLTGEFSQRIDVIAGELKELRALVEASIDFPEDEVDFLAEGAVLQRVRALCETVAGVTASARQGALLAEGLTVVLAGPPNVGKSSLLNRLAGQERAIVTEIPGTTRDVLSVSVELDGVLVELVDTAGLRASEDPVEREGVRRARAQLEVADLVLLMADASAPAPNTWTCAEMVEIPGRPVLRVLNKIDLCAERPGPGEVEAELCISARTGAGLAELRQRLKQRLGIEHPSEGLFTARRRHLDALAQTTDELVRAAEAFEATGAGELLAEDLRHAHDHLGEITGRVSADQLLGEIFARFCIGK